MQWETAHRTAEAGRSQRIPSFTKPDWVTERGVAQASHYFDLLCALPGSAVVSWNDQLNGYGLLGGISLGQGGTANLAVLGGNLPPSSVKANS